MEKNLTKQTKHISAGAIIFKKMDDTVKVLAMYRKNSDTWHLPKGTKENGEDMSITTQREVLEETGYKINILSLVGKLESIIEREAGIVIPKETTYYIAQLADDRPQSKHDHEHDQVEFVEINKLINLINNKRIKGYENEHLILKKFLESGVHF